MLEDLESYCDAMNRYRLGRLRLRISDLENITNKITNILLDCNMKYFDKIFKRSYLIRKVLLYYTYLLPDNLKIRYCHKLDWYIYQELSLYIIEKMKHVINFYDMPGYLFSSTAKLKYHHKIGRRIW